MLADAPQEKHHCLACGADISHLRRDAQRCHPCSQIHNRQRAKSHYWANRAEKLRYMEKRRQTPEYRQTTQEWRRTNPNKVLASRERAKQRRREKTGYNPEGRTCEDCHADIPADRGHRSKRCERCSTRPTRLCIVCGDAISRRGPSKYCSESCKVHDRQRKESEGLTQTCSKCNETKEYTEFGLHYNVRRSVCKICEVKDESERYHKLNPAQRARRRRLRRGREQLKRASLSQEQRAKLKIKERETLMRRRFGDFDEYTQYVKQGGKCAICGIGRPFKRDTAVGECLELDHDHATGKPRGLLCKNCNLKLLSRYERFPLEHRDSPHLNEYLSQGKQQ